MMVNFTRGNLIDTLFTPARHPSFITRSSEDDFRSWMSSRVRRYIPNTKGLFVLRLRRVQLTRGQVLAIFKAVIKSKAAPVQSLVDMNLIQLLGRLLLDKSLAMLESDVCDVLGLAVESVADDVWGQLLPSWSHALSDVTAIAHNHAHLAACLYHDSVRVRLLRQSFTLNCIQQAIGESPSTRIHVRHAIYSNNIMSHRFKNSGDFFTELLLLLRRVNIPTNEADVRTNHEFYGLVRLVDTAVEVGREFVKAQQESYAQLSQLVQHWDGRIVGNKAIRVDRSKVCDFTSILIIVTVLLGKTRIDASANKAYAACTACTTSQQSGRSLHHPPIT